jgi:CBS-domain-containing membrane protein
MEVRTMKTLVKDVMTTRVVWVRRDASFKEMATALREHRVSAFPVIDDEDKVIGVVSEADMLTKEALNGEPGVFDGILHRRDQQKARGITAGDLMTRPAVTVRPEDTIEHTAQLMYSRKVKRLPVVDAAGRLAGIVSRVDVLAVFDRSDEEIRQEIARDLMIDRFLVDPNRLMVSVKDGVVTLAGIPETNEVGHEIVRQIRHIPGVVAVRDRLSYPPSERRRGFDVLAGFPMD